MPIKKRSQTLSKSTLELLASGETESVDFKAIPGGITADDLVAFANSGGGQFLVGVVESSSGGAQTGEVRGCDVGDGAILQILNRASSCVPPVSIDVYVENLDQEPILRVVVPPSRTLPHCTPKGLYCRREGTRTRALHPSEILDMFLEIEAHAFARKFEAAADRIANHLTELEESLDASISRMADQLGWADYQLGNTESTVDSILAIASRVDDRAADINSRLRELFRQDDRADPVKDRERKKFIKQLIEQIESSPQVHKAVLQRREISFSPHGKAAVELTEEELKQAFREATQRVRREHDLQKYTRETKSPSECSETEVEQFVSLVSLGGEVADGVRNRIARAKTLGFVKYDGHPVGVAAIKRPLKTYKSKVFTSSKSELDPADFSLELGWIYLKENHRKKGQITPLLERMLSTVSDKEIFATTRSSNVVMRELLLHFGFTISGKSYPSIEHPDETLTLFVRRS